MLERLVRMLADECAEVRAGESACVVCGADADATGNVLAGLARRLHAHLNERGALSLLVALPAEALGAPDGAGLPHSLKDALASAGVAFLLTGRLFPAEVRARALRAGCRIVSACGLDEGMLRRIAATDHRALEAATVRAGRLFEHAGWVRMSSPAGTNLRVSVRGMRPVLFTGRATRAGELTALPAGVVGIACKEGSAEGTLVIDGSIKDIGVVSSPVTLRVEKGEVVDIQGADEARRLSRVFEAAGPGAASVCEIGLGTNPWAVQTGIMIEDERVLGYGHVGFGRNTHLGGNIRAGIHLDTTFRQPELEIGPDPAWGGGMTCRLDAATVRSWYGVQEGE